MAKKKRKNITRPKPPKEISRTQQERNFLFVKKMMPLFDLEPDMLDVFTKKQKQLLFGLIFEFPSVKAEKENTVPRRFVEKIREEMLQFMRKNYFGNPEYKITFMDFTIYGFAFFNLLNTRVEDGAFIGLPQEETAKKICDTIEKSELFNNDGYSSLQNFMIYQTRSYSQVNFRLYGFNFAWESVPTKITVDGFTTMQMRIQLTVHNCETKMFKYNNIDRKAFRLIYTADGEEKTRGAVINKDKIYPNAKKDEKLNIYIQSHALNRYKQRVDILDPKDRNYHIQHVLITEQKAVRYEKQQFLACILDGAIIGYFTYFVREADLVVNTFLPIVSENTPEGEKFRDLLLLSKEDILYLGMDKLSFYATIDFEQIPSLKQALIDADIWKTKIAVDNEIKKNGDIIIDENKTLFVKKFIDKHEQYRAEISLSDCMEMPSLNENRMDVIKTFRQASHADCALIYELAAPTWKIAYAEILSDEQMAYMLEMMYSEESLKRQMQEGHIFFIVLCDGVPSGFISFHHQDENIYILEKLYVLPEVQGAGAGRFLVEKAEEHILQQHPAGKPFLFELNVNRSNPAVGFYQKLGFHIDREVDEDIGNGFYKNDYIMQKVIENIIASSSQRSSSDQILPNI